MGSIPTVTGSSIQMSSGDGEVSVKMSHLQKPAPNLARMLADEKVEKLLILPAGSAALANGIGPVAGPVYCTKIASKLIRTYIDRHGLSELVREICVSRFPSSSNHRTGRSNAFPEQQAYAATMCFICTRSVRNLISG